MLLTPSTTLKICNPSTDASSNTGRPWPQFTLVGRSRAGEATSFAIPEFKLLFDCGTMIQGWKPSHIFISHTHMDHVHALPYHNQRPPEHPTSKKKNVRQAIIPVYVPDVSASLLQRFLDAQHAMNEHAVDDSTNQAENDAKQAVETPLELRPTRTNEEFVVRQGSREFVCRPIACHHRIPCLGYSLFQRIQKLKEEYVGRAGSEIGQLRKQGVTVTSPHLQPLICFLGDTTAQVFDSHPEILTHHRVVVVECSFKDPRDVEHAKETRHMHWQDLQPHMEAHPNVLFILTHFSLKHMTLEWREFFVECNVHRNIHPMLIQEDVEREWQKLGREGDAPTCNCFLCSASL